VSAHVLPKAPTFSMNDEEEKTTIESGWEEEASTTVEQGEVADKIRALGRNGDPSRRPNTSITSTNGGSMPDEPTVDDQRAAAALAMLPPPIVARLVITQGNDSGQSLEVRPGKTYTIGRGIDNDLVLTDIAVSRKHFDIRSENGSWVLADRGSGNGTLVNQRIEDAPFTLASGDTIEIGNTAFRFDFPNGLARVPSSYDVSVDDDLELSTVSGKPLREAEVATPLQHVAPITTPLVARITTPMGPSTAATAAAIASPGLPPRTSPSTAFGEPLARPKTLPPPSPLPRPRTQSNRPPVGYALDRPGPHSTSQPLPMPSLAAALAPTMSPMQSVQALPPPPIQSTTLAMPQMANRSPLPPAALTDPPLSTVPSTIPGQGLPVPAHHGRMPFSYPRASEQQRQLAPNGLRGQPMLVATALPGRDATSTALVQPISYGNGQAAAAPTPPYARPTPQLSRRVKMALAGAGLALFAAVATIAIIKGTSGDGDRTGDAAEVPPKLAPPSKPALDPVHDPRAVKVVPTTPPITPVTTKPDKVTTTATTSSPPPSANPTASSPPPSSNANPTTTPPTPPSGVTTAPANPVTTKPDKVAMTTPAPTASSPTAPTPVTPTTANSTTANPTTAKSDKIATTPPVATTPPPVATSTADPNPTATAKSDKRNLKHPDDKRNLKKPTPPRNDGARVELDRPSKVELAPASAKTDKKHGGRSTQDVKNDANALYRAKRFADAAALVTAALPSFSGGDSQELKAVAAVFSQLGKTYNVGMAPGTKPTDAFVALRKAIAYDRDVGAAYVPEMERVLVTVASKAALSYAAAKEYELAFTAVRTAEALGSQSPTNKSVRDKLEDLAGELLRSASSEQASDPEDAKKKLRQIQGMVDPKSPLYAKATKQLSSP